VVLDLVSVALTVLAAVLAIRLVRGQERILRERADELDQFAGRVAHDIKSPLATTSAALWVAGKDAGPRGLAAIERAQRAMNRVQRLVEGLLELARGGAVRDRGTSEVREVLDDVLAELAGAAESARVVVHTEPGETPPVACSPGVLTSVLSNLVRNAIVHMGGGEAREVWIRTRSVAERGVVRVEVEDTGPGIPASLGERVFEPFVRGPGTEVSDGTGLGLATAKRIVDAHAGRIGFHPGAGRGTVFWFELPAAPNGVAAAPPAPVRAS
jgi:signal transduction histidine kinase